METGRGLSYVEAMFAGNLPWAYASLFLVSLGANAAIIVIFRRLSTGGRCINDLKAVQAMHEAPTPRVGGLAFLVGMLSLIPLALIIDVNFQNLVWYIICLTPVVAAGLAEDVGYHISPRGRLAASVLSGALVVFFFQLTIDRSGISVLDAALAITPLAIAFTLFATAGIVNAFNVIDGLNGFAAFTALSVTVSLSLLAHQVGQPRLALTMFLLAPLLLGFLPLNYPFGKIFLGDAGAYLIGFTLAWLAVGLYASEAAISPFALLLIFFWPIADTMLAIWRRTHRGASSVQPDKLHFHQLAIRWLLLKTNMSKRIANPVATLTLLPPVVIPQAAGILTWDDFGSSLGVLIAFAFIFVASYLAGVTSAQRHRTGASTPKIQQQKASE